MPAKPKPGRCPIVAMDSLDDIVARVIEVAAQLDKPIALVSGRDMRDPGGVTDRNIQDFGGLKQARARAMQALGEEVRRQDTPKDAAKKVAKKRKTKKTAKIRRGAAKQVEGWSSALMFGDTHNPKHDPGFLSAVLACAADTKPDHVILGGDMGEFESVSTYSGGGLDLFEDDVWCVNWLLDQVQAASPDSKVWYLEGNHETRLARYLKRYCPSLVGTFDIPSKLRLEERGIVWVPQKMQPLDIGGLRVIHGHQDLRGWGSLYSARKMAQRHGMPGKVTVVFHTHKLQSFDEPHSFGRSRCITLPCGRDLRPDWKDGETDAWSQGWGMAHFTDTSARVQPVTYADGIAIHGGRSYS